MAGTSSMRVTSEWHRRISIRRGDSGAAAAGWYFWLGWLLWAVLLVAIGFRHPPLIDRWEPLDRMRRIWAVVALAIFLSVLHARAVRTDDS